MLEALLNKKTLLNTLLIAVILGGLFAYMKIGKLEDAEIAIKSAVVYTIYPGATAHEVELEVTDVLEKAIQKLENIDEIESRSMPGVSEITIKIDSKLRSHEMPQIWDHLRRKVNDVKSQLPQGAQEPIVNDDFGDVYGIFVAVTGQGYDYKEFYDYVDLLRREFLDVEGVKRIELFGVQTEVIEVLFSKEKMAELNLNPMFIIQALQDQGQVVNPGSLLSGTERIRLSVGNKFSNIEEIQDFLVQVPDGGSFRLGDITEIKRSFLEPKREAITYNGERAISMAMSMEKGVNVIDVGELFDKKLEDLYTNLPAGIEVNKVFSQPERVKYSINGFIINLIESILIVVVVLLIAMGMRSGLLIASGLIFTILATFIVMLLFDLQLQRISLAAIIVAMGMLVDNAIVIADGIIIDLKRGVEREKAFTSIVKRTALPLLGATVIAVMAFWPLSMSPDGAGEYLSSLFQVLAISLLLSWLFAMVQTPYMASMFYKKNLPKAKKGQNGNPFDAPLYNKFRIVIQWALSHKTLFLTASIAILIFSFYSFKFVRFQFMSLLDYNQFVIEYKLPKGTDIDAVEEDLNEISVEILKWEEVESVVMSVGRTPARYTLLRPMAKGGENYGELIVDAENYDMSVIAAEKILKYVHENYPQAESRKRLYGPIFSEFEIEAQFSGPDPAVLRNLSEQAKTIMRNDPWAESVTDNWKNKVKVVQPTYSVEKARKASVSRSDLSSAISIATDGMIVGVMHEGNATIPLLIRLDESIGNDLDKISSIPVWSRQGKNSVPLGQVSNELELKWEDDEIYRFDGKRTIKAQCSPISGVLTVELEEKLRPLVGAIPLPNAYTLEWKGTSADSAESQSNLFKFLPLALGIMFMIVIFLFNNIKHAIIIFAIFPFAFVGIVFGFVSTGAVYSFIGIIGSLGLIGMMSKNTIVLLDEINQNLKEGLSKIESIVMAAISRMRPVLLASATTMLGMLPLLFDVMFKSLAITIIFGLLFGTLITLLVVPVMYASLFRVDTSSLSRKNRKKA